MALIRWWERSFMRLRLWSLDMDIAIIDTQVVRMARDREEFIRLRSDLIIELINMEPT